MQSQKQTATDTFTLAYNYWLQQPAEPKQVILLLHGFSQRGESIFNKLKDVMPKDAVVISPNAPFPSPVRIHDEYKEAYAWYFYLSKEKRFVIPPTESSQSMKRLLTDLGFASLPITIIGFSQGGYMAPWLVRDLQHIKQVISIAADYPAHYYEGLPLYPFTALHGVDDSVAPISSVRRNVEILKQVGRPVDFFEISDTGHEINAMVIDKIASLL